MPDFGAPVAGRNPPPDGMTQLSGLMDLSLKGQALQTGKYTQRTAAAAANVAEGTQQPHIDLATQQARNATTVADTSALNLAQQKANALASRYAGAINHPLVLAAEKDPNSVNKDALSQSVKDWGYQTADNLGIPKDKADQLMAPYMDLAQKNPGELRQFMKSRLIDMLDSSSKVGAINPAGVERNTGAVSNIVSQNEFGAQPVGEQVPGTWMKKDVPPGMATFTDQNGNTWATNPQNPGHAILVGQGGKLSSGGGAQPPAQNPGTAQPQANPAQNPGGPPVLSMGDQQAIPSLNDERTAARQLALNAGIQHENNRLILTNIDKVAATGFTGPAMRELSAAAGLRSGEEATSWDMVGKGLERSAIQAANSMGPQTNAGLQAQIAANGNRSYTPDAIRKITKLNDAITTGAEAYSPGLEKAIAAAGSKGILAKRDFDARWGANFDPRIYELYNAKKSGDTQALKEIVASLGGTNSPQYKALLSKAANLHSLSQTGSLGGK